MPEREKKILDDILTPSSQESQEASEGFQYTPPGQITTPDTTEEEITWGEVGSGFVLNLVPSFGSNAWNVVTGVPGLPQLFWELGKEISRSGDISPVRGRVRGAGLSKERIQALGGGGLTPENAPILYAIIEDYENRFGSIEGLKRALRDDPFSVLVEVMPALSKAAKAGKLGKLSKALQIANPEELVGNLLELVPNQRPGMGYNPETAAQAEKFLGPGQGTSKGNVPAMILSDSGTAEIIETAQFNEPGRVGQQTQGRFDESRAGIQGFQEGLISNKGISSGYDPTDLTVAGDQLIQNFNEVKLGNRGATSYTYDNIANTVANGQRVADYQVPAIDNRSIVGQNIPNFQKFLDRVRSEFDLPNNGQGYELYFFRTLQALDKLSGVDSSLLGNKGYQRVREIIKGIVKNANENGFTVQDFRNMRTNFREELDLAVGNKEITPTGKGQVEKILYYGMTEDMYTMLGEVVDNLGLDPSFVSELKMANARYKDIIAKENTHVGRQLFKNQYRGEKIIDSILKGGINSVVRDASDLADLRTLIGNNGWNDLEPALLSRLFDLSLRNGQWSPTGLRNSINTVNNTNKGKLEMLFGDAMASDLKVLAEFSAKFARQPTSHSKRQANFLQAMIGDRTASSVLVRVAEGGLLGYTMVSGDIAKTAAIGGLAAALNWVGSAASQAWRNSPNGRRALLEGGMEFGGVELSPQDVQRAVQIARTATRTAIHIKQSEKRGKRQRTRMGEGRFDIPRIQREVQ